MEKSYKLHIENFLTIQSLDLDLTPGVSGFVGNNAQGKTNILKAIDSLLNGANDPSLIKNGEDKATILLEEVTNGVTTAKVTRTQTEKGSNLSGTCMDGRTPKSILSSILNDRAINPIRIISDDPVAYLRQHLSVAVLPEDMLDAGDLISPTENVFSECERLVAEIGDERKALRKELTYKKEMVASMKSRLPLDRPNKAAILEEEQEAMDILKATRMEEEASAIVLKDKAKLQDERRAKLLEKIAYQEQVDKADAKKLSISTQIDTEARSISAAIDTHKKEIDALTQKIALLEEKRLGLLEKEVELFRMADDALAEATKRVEEFDTMIRLLDEKISLIIEPNKEQLAHDKEMATSNLAKCKVSLSIVNQWEELDAQSASNEILSKQFDRLDEKYKYYAYTLPRKLIERANLPIEGLEIKDGELIVNNCPIDKLSSAERSIVAVKIAVALAKQKGHVAVCLDGIEIMDKAHRDEFLSAVKDSGIRVLYTRMGEPEYEFEKVVINGEVK